MENKKGFQWDSGLEDDLSIENSPVVPNDLKKPAQLVSNAKLSKRDFVLQEWFKRERDYGNVQEFCTAYDVPLRTFMYWRKKYLENQ